jgi:glutathione S-transferase
LIDPIVSILINKVFRPEEHRHEYSIQSAEQSFAKTVKTLNSIMEGRTYIMGDDFTAADIVNGYTLRLADNLKLLSSTPETENVVDYFKSLQSRAAYQKAIADTKS